MARKIAVKNGGRNKSHFSIGEVSQMTGLPVWRIRRLANEGKIPEPDWIGGNRGWTKAQVERVQKMLVDAFEEKIKTGRGPAPGFGKIKIKAKH